MATAEERLMKIPAKASGIYYKIWLAIWPIYMAGKVFRKYGARGGNAFAHRWLKRVRRQYTMRTGEHWTKLEGIQK